MSERSVVPLGRTPPPEPPEEPSRPRTWHGIAMTAMAASGLVSIVTSVAFLTVTWSGGPRRAVIATILFSVLIFLTSASMSFLTAARDTYARGDRSAPKDTAP